MNEKIRYASVTIVLPPSTAVPNSVLVRFRRYIEGERLDAHIIAEFLKSREHWWLLTTSVTERVHAAKVLNRLWVIKKVAEIQAEAEEAIASGGIMTEQKRMESLARRAYRASGMEQSSRGLDRSTRKALKAAYMAGFVRGMIITSKEG